MDAYRNCRNVLVECVNILGQITRFPILCRCVVDGVDWALDVDEALDDFSYICNMNEGEPLRAVNG